MNRKRFRSRSPNLEAGRFGNRVQKQYVRDRREDIRQHQSRRAVDHEARDWLAKEDEFVLEQAKKKSRIRVAEGRAQPIDWLSVTLTTVNPERNVLEDDGAEEDLDVMDPIELVGDLSKDDLMKLESDIEHYLTLEKHRGNRQFWQAMKLFCRNQQPRLDSTTASTGPLSSVAVDIDNLIGSKTKGELSTLERQVRHKLQSDDSIDFEYWQRLLENIQFYQAKEDLRSVYQSALDSRMQKFKRDQAEEARSVRYRLHERLKQSQGSSRGVEYSKGWDPEPQLKMEAVDRKLATLNERDLLQDHSTHITRLQRKAYIPARSGLASTATQPLSVAESSARGVLKATDNAEYDREVAHGLEDDEELFAAEEEVQTTAKRKWEASYRARKPKHVNRVQMGYEWNKYNQTHYDQDNPPPKVVQGYRFNIFYPDLIDKSKAPTYRIERENGRKKGQSLAPAGEEDTCIIRFMSGPPYEDLAFRIVDKEWDYSAKKERGFRSTFDKDVLQLHFQFKKVYYRK